MVNEEKTPAPVKAVLSDGEMTALLNMAGIRPGKASPLAQINGKSEPDAARALRQAGLIDANSRPTPGCLECLNVLASPVTEIGLVWGNPDGVSLSKVYAAAGSDRLVSFTGANGSNHLSFFLSPTDVSDLIAEKTVQPEIKDAPDLSFETIPEAAPVIFAVLDAYREAQLKAALERRQSFEVKIDPEEINRVIQEAKMEMNLAWYAPAGNIAMPQDSAVTAAAISEGINTLKREGVIGADNALNTAGAAFANRAFPLIAFCGVRAVTPAETTQFALFRGLSTLLLVQYVNEGAADSAIVQSISTSQLPQILFTLATKPFETAAPPAAPAPAPAATANAVTCSSCAAVNTAGARFCAKCGKPLEAAAGPKFCPKCGTQLKSAEKFCAKCGNKLV